LNQQPVSAASDFFNEIHPERALARTSILREGESRRSWDVSDIAIGKDRGPGDTP
jgi:hypothetical protein